MISKLGVLEFKPQSRIFSLCVIPTIRYGGTQTNRHPLPPSPPPERSGGTLADTH
jgi:hypothetical protein